MQPSRHYDVVVIGAGAAGCMAALVAAESGKRVAILEKNRRIGQKLRITGGGRCNITNAEFDVPTLLKFYGNAEQSLYSLFSQFGVKETFTFFEERGVPLVVQGFRRAFPKSEMASDVVGMFEHALRDAGVVCEMQSPVTSLEVDERGIAFVTCGTAQYHATDFILATGGVSHKDTGSTGDGFAWLVNLGHTIAPPTPSIVPLAIREAWVHALAGIALDRVGCTFLVNGKRRSSRIGKMLFTHFGVSGPLILNSAAAVGDLLHEGVVTLEIDLFPKEDRGVTERTLLAVFEEHKNKSLKNCVPYVVPVGFAKGLLMQLEALMDTETKVHSVTREDRKKIVALMRAMPMTVSHLMGFEKAVVADGGVSIAEIDTKTMRSRLVPNLFIIGDLLNIRRPSGGYSLQLCWSMGYVAGKNAARV